MEFVIWSSQKFCSIVVQVMYECSNTVVAVPCNYHVWVVVAVNQVAIVSVADSVHECQMSDRKPLAFRTTRMLSDEYMFVEHVVDCVPA